MKTQNCNCYETKHTYSVSHNLFCIRLSKCGLFSNKHNGMASIKTAKTVTCQFSSHHNTCISYTVAIINNNEERVWQGLKPIIWYCSCACLKIVKNKLRKLVSVSSHIPEIWTGYQEHSIMLSNRDRKICNITGLKHQSSYSATMWAFNYSNICMIIKLYIITNNVHSFWYTVHI